jgi:hypothetical protein
MTEPEESKSRVRWFQFDLRLMFVLIAAVGVVLAFELARRAKPAGRELRDTLRVGDNVILNKVGEGFEITIQRGTYNCTITEIGRDFIAAASIDGEDVLVPLAKLQRIVRLQPPSPAPAIGMGPPGGMMPGGGGGMPGMGGAMMPGAGSGVMPGDGGAPSVPSGIGVPDGGGGPSSVPGPQEGGSAPLPLGSSR